MAIGEPETVVEGQPDETGDAESESRAIKVEAVDPEDTLRDLGTVLA